APLRENTAGPCTCSAVLIPEAFTPTPSKATPSTPMPPLLTCPCTPVPEKLTPSTPWPVRLTPSTPSPSLLLWPLTATPLPAAKHTSAELPTVEFVICVVSVSGLSWPRTTGSPLAAAAGAGRVRASTESTAAKAPLPPASTCRLERHATGLLIAWSVVLGWSIIAICLRSAGDRPRPEQHGGQHRPVPP